MYKTIEANHTGFEINKSLEGETIETKVERITINKEPIKDGAPLLYTSRAEGVLAGYNVKTDRFEVAVEAMDKITKSNLAKRDNIAQMQVVKDGEADSIQGNGTEK